MGSSLFADMLARASTCTMMVCQQAAAVVSDAGHVALSAMCVCVCVLVCEVVRSLRSVWQQGSGLG